MPMCTYLGDTEGLGDTHSSQVDALIKEVRETFKADWRVLEIRIPDRKHGFLWMKREVRYRYSIVRSVSSGEFQVINFWQPWDWTINTYVAAELAIAYLWGLIAGHHDTAIAGAAGEITAS